VQALSEAIKRAKEEKKQREAEEKEMKDKIT
jgi:hypothetical protein